MLFEDIKEKKCGNNQTYNYSGERINKLKRNLI